MIRSVIWAPLLIVLASCGSSTPSDSQARKVVEASYQDLTQLGAKIIDFRKLNAESKEVFGQKVYEYTFLAAVEFPSGCAWKRNPSMPSFIEVVRDTGKKSDEIYKYTSIPKGTVGVRRGIITFRYTEQGWVSADLPGKFDDGYCTSEQPEACYRELKYDKLN